MPFDLASLSVSGGRVPIVEGVRRSTLIASPAMAQFSYSATGALAFLPGPRMESVDLALFDRKGEATPLRLPSRPYGRPACRRTGGMSPSTSRITGAAVWVYELAGGKSMRQLTFGGKNRIPFGPATAGG